MLKDNFQNKVILVFIFALVTFFGTEILSYASLNALIDTANWVNHTHLVLGKIESLLGALRETELEKRVYAITGDKRYLRAFQASVPTVKHGLKILRALWKDNPKQIALLNQVSPKIEAELKEAEKVTRVRQQEGVAEAIAMILQDPGLAVLEENQAFINRLREEENRLLLVRYHAAKSSRQETVFVYLLAAIIDIFLLAMAYIMINREMIRRQEAEEKIQSLNQQLEKELLKSQTSNKELEAFSYSVSHDLRAPLRSLDGFSKLLLTEYKDSLSGEGLQYLKFISENTVIMGQLIDALLMLSRVTRQEMKFQDVDLSDTAKKIAQELERQAESDNRKISFDIADHVTGTGDPGLLHIVLQNLLENAYKFTRKCEIAKIEFGCLKTEPKTEPAGSELPEEKIYYVKDNGVGFDMAYAGKLFGAFQRLHDKSEFPGTGIGLATIQRIISRHGGRVWAEGKLNEGATLYFTLPQKSILQSQLKT